MEKQAKVKPEDRIDLLDFDLLGMLRLTDVKDIEFLVTPAGKGEYISRSRSYKTDNMTCAEASNIREWLKTTLRKYPTGKKAYVILDYMANLSGKVYYEEIQRTVNDNDSSGLAQAKQCLLDDITNVINIFEDRPAQITEAVLPESQEPLAFRNIECNNLALLYCFAKNFECPEGYNILNPGLGGVFIGPMLSSMYGVEWTNLLKSKYVDEKSKTEKYDVIKNTVNIDTFDNGKILILDDNVGTGDTLREIEMEYLLLGYDVKVGGVQYNWRNFYRVGIGEKDQARFNPMTIDYVTQYSFPGNHLLKHAYAILYGERDLEKNVPSKDNSTPWGKLYIDYLASKSYGPDFAHYLSMQCAGIEKCMESFEKSRSKPLKITDDNQLATDIFKPSCFELMKRIDSYNQVLGERSRELKAGKGTMGE